MSFVTTAIDRSSRNASQSAAVSVVLPAPTGPARYRCEEGHSDCSCTEYPRVLGFVPHRSDIGSGTLQTRVSDRSPSRVSLRNLRAEQGQPSKDGLPPAAGRRQAVSGRQRRDWTGRHGGRASGSGQGAGIPARLRHRAPREKVSLFGTMSHAAKALPKASPLRLRLQPSFGRGRKGGVPSGRFPRDADAFRH